MFETSAGEDPVGFLTAAVEQLAKLPSQLWQTGNEGFGEIAAAMDALAVQVDCAGLRSSRRRSLVGWWTSRRRRRRRRG